MKKKNENKYTLKLYEAIFIGAAILFLVYLALSKFIVPLIWR